jgi:hypothetical protein
MSSRSSRTRYSTLNADSSPGLAIKSKQFQEIVGRKASLVEDAFERGAFEVFAMEGNSNDSGAGRLTEELM